MWSLPLWQADRVRRIPTRALDLPFSFNSLSAGCTESHIIGRVLPDEAGNWTYRPSPFVRAYRDGGVHLFDEIDAADPNLLVLINAALPVGGAAGPQREFGALPRGIQAMRDQMQELFRVALANRRKTRLQAASHRSGYPD